MLLFDYCLIAFVKYLLAIVIISLLVVGEWELGVMLTKPQPEDCIALLLDRN